MGLEKLLVFSSAPGWSGEEGACGISPQKTECVSPTVSWWDLGRAVFSSVVLALLLSKA